MLFSVLLLAYAHISSIIKYVPELKISSVYFFFSIYWEMHITVVHTTNIALYNKRKNHQIQLKNMNKKKESNMGL